MVSGTTRSRVGEVPGGLGCVDLGEHRLRDLAGPERVFELRIDALGREFPPIRSLGAFVHNLPTQFTSFVGRADEVRVVEKLLSDTRHVSLVGAGGLVRPVWGCRRRRSLWSGIRMGCGMWICGRSRRGGSCLGWWVRRCGWCWVVIVRLLIR